MPKNRLSGRISTSIAGGPNHPVVLAETRSTGNRSSTTQLLVAGPRMHCTIAHHRTEFKKLSYTLGAF